MYISFLFRSVILLLVFSLMGCGKAELSRSSAKDMIQGSPELKELSQKLPLNSAAGSKARALNILSPNGALTSKGSQLFSKFAYAEAMLVQPVSPPDVEITGIASVPMAEDMKEVQFDVAFKFPPAIKRFAASGGKGVASFRRYDDGWRLEGVKISSSREPYPLTAQEQNEEQSEISAVLEEQRKAAENQAKHIQESRIPKKVIETISFPTFAYLGNKAHEKSITQEIILTDVDVEFITYEGGKTKVWFGNIYNMGEVGNSFSVAIAAYPYSNAWVLIDNDQRRKYFMTALKSAIDSWRANYGDVRHD